MEGCLFDLNYHLCRLFLIKRGIDVVTEYFWKHFRVEKHILVKTIKDIILLKIGFEGTKQICSCLHAANCLN